MKGLLILLFSAFSPFILPAVCASAQERQAVADTLDASIVMTEEARMKRHTGLKRLDAGLLTGVPALLGTPDVIKFLQNYPGVSSGMELISGLYVHGGDGSDNLFLLDGVPLYRVCHLAGLFSSFNTDVVKSIDFYRSGFPVRYGGRLDTVSKSVSD